MAERPGYREIVEEFRDRIARGELRDGDRLPPEREIAAQFEVSRMTARHALQALQHEGLVVSRTGSGTFVRSFSPILRESPGRLAQARWGSGEAIQDADTGPRPRTVDVRIEHVPAPTEIADVLGLGPNQRALRRSRRFVVEDRAVQAAVSWFDLEMVATTAIASTDSGPGGVYARLAELGHGPVRFREVVRAAMPTPEVQQLLNLPPGTSAFLIVRYAYDAEDRCVEINQMTLDASAYVLAYDFRA